MSEVKKVYCHCAYAKIIPAEVKEAVLKEIAAASEDVICVPDICEMAAKKDTGLNDIFSGQVKLAACYERSVKWLCHTAGVDVKPENVEIINMRNLEAEEVCERLLGE